MIADIRKLVAREPFVPFTIHLGDGSSVRVPTFDHIFIFPHGTRVIVANDDDTHEIIAPLLISHLTVDSESSIPSA